MAVGSVKVKAKSTISRKHTRPKAAFRGTERSEVRCLKPAFGSVLLGLETLLSSMSDQQYVYTLHETEGNKQSIGDLDAIINEYASEGWHLTETIARNGTTIGLVFEREVS